MQLQNHLKSIGEGLIPLILQNQLANIHETLDSLKHSNSNWKKIQLHDKKGNRLYPITLEPITNVSKNIIHIRQPINLFTQKVATLYLSVDISEELNHVNKLKRNLITVLLILLIIVVFSIAGLLEWIVSLPLRQLSHASEYLARGKYDIKLPKANQDEVGHLIRAFEHMSTSLNQYKSQVELEIKEHKQTTQELIVQRKRLAYQATHDSLTGLLNRREFELRLNAAIDRARDESVIHAVFFIDLDRFKIINDSSGHLAGDELLKQISSLITKHIRNSDSVARLGGDEFAILLEFCPVNIATQTVSTLHKSIQEFTFHWNDKSFNVGASIGIAFITNQTKDLLSVLLEADSACYSAKAAGRNRYYFYENNHTSIQNPNHKADSVNLLMHALKNEKFILYAQVIQAVDSNQYSRIHYEMLIRMLGNDNEIILPQHFIPIAERYHLMPQIDRWVIENTLLILENINKASDKSISFSINLSGVSMSDEHLLPFIREHLLMRNINPKDICFEVTETAAISDIENAKKLISELKSLGCEFALDDFGSGFSSFDYLKNLKMDYLKIDGTFVRNIIHDRIDAAMVSSIHDIGKVLGMKTIAEFVENEEILKVIGDLGIDFVQGYGVGKPMPINKLYADLGIADIEKKGKGK